MDLMQKLFFADRGIFLFKVTSYFKYYDCKVSQIWI